MMTLYFCLDGAKSVARDWQSVPRIGETIALPELGGNLNLLRVYDVIWEGTIEPIVSIYLRHAKVDHALCHDWPHGMRRQQALNELLPQC